MTTPTTPERGRDGLREAIEALGAGWSMLADREVILCRTCMRPLTWETRTEPGFLPREGWYDDARTDPLVCFKAADFRHVPLTDREWAYYEAGAKSVTEHPATGDEENGRSGQPAGKSGGLDDAGPVPHLDSHRRQTAPPACDVDSDNAAAGGAEALAYQILALFPMDEHGTGHIADCGYDANDERCDCLTLPERIRNVLAAHVAKVKAEALREAAECPHGPRHYYAADATCQRCGLPSWVEALLRDRADRIEGGGANV